MYTLDLFNFANCNALRWIRPWSEKTNFFRAPDGRPLSRGIGIVILDAFAARQIRVPVEEIYSEEEEGKHHAADAVDLRHRVVSGRSPTSSAGRRSSTGRRRLSRRRAAGHARYLPVIHRGIFIRYRDRRQRYHLDHTVAVQREATAAASARAAARGALSAGLKKMTSSLN